MPHSLSVDPIPRTTGFSAEFLGAIKNAAYYLQLTLQSPTEDVSEMLQVLEREVVRATDIIQSVLGFARSEPLARRDVSVNQVLRSALGGIGVPSNVTVVWQLDDALPVVQGDETQLGSVVSNLVQNASQAMPDGGWITMRSGVEDGDWVTVAVSDTGTGISREHLARLFELLYSTKEGGVGLGLALAKMLVIAHGGAISVESQEGVGTTFTVRLPIGQARR